MQVDLGIMCCLIFHGNVMIHTQEMISTDFEIPVSMRQRNIRVGIRLFLDKTLFKRSRVSESRFHSAP